MIRVIADLSLAFALLIAGRFVLALGARSIRSLRSRHNRSRDCEPDYFGRQVQGVRVHTQPDTVSEAYHHVH